MHQRAQADHGAGRPSRKHRAISEASADRGGSLTCGPDEYCDVQCTCCGMMIPDAAAANAAYACKPCTGDVCDSPKRTVEHPCA
jgi:hypothetical protein